MAEQQPGLSTNPGNINPTGANPQALQEYQDSLEAQIKSLEDRYSNPNWFKVAAGFLKPQLGGFAASLGSASEALGENVEAGRAAALPIAQMRSQLAQSKILTQQNQDVSSEITQWQKEHPGEMPTPGQIAIWSGKAPGLPAVKSLVDQQEGSLKQNTLLTNQNQVALDLLGKRRLAGDINEDDYRTELQRILASTQGAPSFPKGKTTEGKPKALTDTTTTDTGAVKKPEVSGSAPVFALGADKSEKTAERVNIYQSELNHAYQLAGQGDPRAADDMKSIIAEAKRLGATLSGAPDAMAGSGAPAPENKPLDTSTFKIKPTFSTQQLHPNAVTGQEKAQDESIKTNAANLEAGMVKRYQNLQAVNEPNAYATAKDANSYLIEQFDAHPDLAVKTTNMLRRAGPAATLLAKGMGITFGGIGGVSVNVAGLQPALNAALPPNEQAYQDGVINAIAKSVYADLKSRGIDPEKEGAEKFGQRMLQETNMDQGPRAIYHSIKQNDIRLLHNRELYGAYNQYLPDAVNAGSLTPLHDLDQQHPEIKIIEGLFDKRLKAEKNRYQGKKKEAQ